MAVRAALVASALVVQPGAAEEENEAPIRDFPFLADESAEGSRSVGDTADGYLVGARRLEESEHLKLLPRQKERGLRYGTDELVATLEHAARALFEATSTPLWVGNVSRPSGGDISWSVSHNSGRDADLAFAYVYGSGNPADPPDLVPLDSRGLAPRFGLRFDAPRTWKIVRALLESPHADVQYLFISTPLRGLLLAHAHRNGEPPALVKRAEEALRQPVGSGAHDDHLHLRLYCSERDVLAGCTNTGVEHPWYRSHDAARTRRVGEVRAFLADPRPEQRRRAIDRLVVLNAEEQVGAIASSATDADPRVRRAAVLALAALDARDRMPRLAELWEGEHDLEVRLALLDAAARLNGPEAGGLLARAVAEPEDGPTDLDRALEAWRDATMPTALSVAPKLFAVPASPHQRFPALDALFTLPLPEDHEWLDPLATRARLAGAMKLAALDAAARSERLEPLRAALSMLESRSPDVRVAADRALAFGTNFARQLTSPAHDEAQHRTAIERWKRALEESPDIEREAWLVAGFRASGYDIPELHPRYAWELVRATAGEDQHSFNAQRVLMTIFRHRPPSLTWPKRDACEHWARWIKTYKPQARKPDPPPEVLAACINARG
jgi:penicillin-insensitive murein endopeptidase